MIAIFHGDSSSSDSCVCLFCAEKHGLLVLKSTAKDSFIQSTFFAKQLTSMTADQLQRNMSAVFLVKSWFPCHIPNFFHPLSSLDPKKIHDSKNRIIILEVVYFTMMMF